MHISSEELVDRIFRDIKPDQHEGKYRDACFDVLRIIKELSAEAGARLDLIAGEFEEKKGQKQKENEQLN